jgi:hypothetical protein
MYTIALTCRFSSSKNSCADPTFRSGVDTLLRPDATTL